MGRGYFLVRGDKTTCGGKIIEGADDHTIMGIPQARDMDRVTCGKYPGMFIIVGGVPETDIHGRLMAGTLDSQSSCPCKARFIASMMDDVYETGGGDGGRAENNTPLAAKGVTSEDEKNKEDNKENKGSQEKTCPHSDGSIKVAEYILSEIKVNVKSSTADSIRYYIDEDIYAEKMKEWNSLPWYLKQQGPPKLDVIAASAIWFMAVKTGAKWDHKSKIRDMFSSVAVARPLPDSGTNSKSYFHKYKGNDYFYDVWSNIHYGYVGLSVGFSEDWLLLGSTIEQWRTSKEGNADPADDITCMKIGMELYRQYGKHAESLTVNHIINALEAASGDSLSVSKQTHWCWNEDNPEKINNPG
ncbi:polymorphic toxin type 44 domain-containing protein [Citrobacter sp. U14242]|uniref:polymorphic toxin type 44 domain-containing protein n=1 Tax=Citrobacter sp. U14242 TaxID=3390192 RepID=UPI00397D361D